MRVTVMETEPKREFAEVSGDNVISMGIVELVAILYVVKNDVFW